MLPPHYCPNDKNQQPPHPYTQYHPHQMAITNFVHSIFGPPPQLIDHVVRKYVLGLLEYSHTQKWSHLRETKIVFEDQWHLDMCDV